jgi:hypothetical protein
VRAEAPRELLVVAVGDFAIEQETEPHSMVHGLGLARGRNFGKGFGHAGKSSACS